VTMGYGEARATFLVTLAKEHCELFLDEEERSFAAIKSRLRPFYEVQFPSPGEPDAAYLIGSKTFHRMLVQLFYASERTIIANSSVHSAVWVLEGLARKNEKRRKIWTLRGATRKAEPTYRYEKSAPAIAVTAGARA
jgi:hypothetical protein